MIDIVATYIALVFTIISVILYAIFLKNRKSDKAKIYRPIAHLFISLALIIHFGLAIWKISTNRTHISIIYSLQLGILIPISLIEIFLG